MTDLQSLLTRLEEAEGPSREIDAAIHMEMCPDDFASKVMRGDYDVESWELGHGGISYISRNSGGTSGGTQPVPHVTASLDAVLALVERVLPGWWWTAGKCGLTCHASVGPDSAFIAEPMLSQFDGGIHADIHNPSTPALALLSALLQAKLAITAPLQKDPT